MLKKFILSVCFCVALRLAAAETKEPSPRLILTDARLTELKELAKGDPVLQRYVSDVLKSADKFCGAKTLEHVLIGPRLLNVSREMLERTYALGLAFRWTGEKKYLDAEEKNLQAVCAFADWNPSHFLDVAEMTHAVAIGYDWLRNDLPPELREHVRKQLIELGLDAGEINVRAGNAFWMSGNNNWTQVCCSGLLIGALAVQDTDDSHWKGLREPLIEGLRKADKLYAPDGAWEEGVGYWHYATSYLVYGLAALESATGSDFDLSKAEGLDRTAYFPIYMTAPGGKYFSFADVHMTSGRMPAPEMFWLAKRFNLADVLSDEHRVLQSGAAKPCHVIWYAPAPADKPAFDLEKIFHGRVSAAVMRTAWNDPDAWWVATKAGPNLTSHGHLDEGSFEFEAGGVRWAVDLGSDDYNMPGYFDMRPDGRRWKYYRLGTSSHNVFTMDGSNQYLGAKTTVASFRPGVVLSTVTLDLTSAYPKAQKAVRLISLDKKNMELRVLDWINLAEKHDVTWGITTKAQIEFPAKDRAVLKQDGRTIHAMIESPPGAIFSTASAEQEAPQDRNAGYRRLEVKLAGVKGEQQIAVKFSK